MKLSILSYIVIASGVLTACYPAPTNTEVARCFNAPAAGPEATAAIHITILNESRPTTEQRQLIRNVLTQAEGSVDYPCITGSMGVCATYLGAIEEAAYSLDAMLAVAGSTLTDPTATEHVLSLSGGEREKLFKGEPYERSMCFIWRGLLYLAGHDDENAAACFRAAEVEDMYGAANEGYWFTARYLTHVAELWNGNRPDPRFIEGAADLGLALPTLDDDTLIVFAVGDGPRKIHVAEERGKIGLSYVERKTPICFVRVLSESDAFVAQTLAPAESLYIQALSRGRREMDAILEAEERLARAKESSADTAEGIGVIAAQFGIFGLPVAAGAALFSINEREKAASADVVADLRTVWGLPALLFVTAVDSASNGMTVQLLDDAGAVLAATTIEPNHGESRRIVIARYR